MPIHALQKLLGYEHRNTIQIYARICDETLYRQFKEDMTHLEAIEVGALPGPEKAKHNRLQRPRKGGIYCLAESRRPLTDSGQGELYLYSRASAVKGILTARLYPIPFLCESGAYGWHWLAPTTEDVSKPPLNFIPQNTPKSESLPLEEV